MNTTQMLPTPKSRIPVWRRIGTNLIIFAIILSIVPVLLVGGFILQRTSEATIDQTISQLESVSALKEAEISRWLDTGELFIETTLANSAIFDVLAGLGQLDNLDPAIQGNMNSILKNSVTLTDSIAIFSELFLYSPSGSIVASSDPTQVGKVVTLQPYYQAGLEDKYIQPPYYQVGSGSLAMFVTRPLTTRSGRVSGVLVGRLNLDTLAAIMTVRAGLGETGETYLVSKDSSYLITPSRFIGFEQQHAYTSEGIGQALNGQNGSGVYTDYRGVEVVGVYRWIPELNAGLLSEIDVNEALLSFRQVSGIGIAVAVGAAVIAGLIALYNAARVSRPITALTQTAASIAQGDYNQRANIRANNELGLLADTFNSMTTQLQDAITGLEERVNDRTRDLETAAEIASAANQVREMDDLFSLTVNLIRDRFDFYYVQVYLIDATGQWAVLKDGTGYVGRKLLARQHRLPVEGNSIVSEVIRTQKPYVVQDTAQDPRFLPNDLLPETRAEIAIPLIAKNQLVGVLDIQHSQPNTFEQPSQQLFQTLADQLAVTFENVTLFESTQKRAVELETVAQVSAQAASSLDLQTLLNDVANLTKKSFGLYHAHIYLLDDAGENLVLAAGAGDIGKQMVAKGHSIPLDREHSLVARAARSRQGVISNDVTKEPDFMPNPLLPETKSEMAIPLVAGDRLLGVLDAQASSVNRFTEEDVRVKTALAGQVAIAIQNARSYERTQAVSEQLSDALRTARLGYWEFDFATGNFVFTDEFYAIIGTTAEAEGGYTMPAEVYSERFVHPDDRHIVGEGIERAIASDDPSYTVEFVSRSIRANGDLAYDHVKYRLEKNAEGRPVRMVGANQDVTERVKAEEALRQNREQLSDALRTARLGYWEFDFTTSNFIFTDEYYDIMGSSAEAEGGYTMPVDVYAQRFVHPDSQHVIAEEIMKALASTDPNYTVEVVLHTIRANGEDAYDLAKFRVERDTAGNPVRGVGATQDITQRVQGEAERERLLAEVDRNARFMRRVIDATPDWIFVKDRNFRYTMVNEGYAFAIANTPDNMLGKDDLELGFPEELVLGDPEQGIVGFRNDDRRVLAGEDIYNPYDVVTFADGSRHIMATQKVPLRDTNGEVYGILAFARDVTELYTAQKETKTLYQVSALINEAHDEQAIIDAVVQHAVGPEISAVSLTLFDTGDEATATAVILAGDWRRDGMSQKGMAIPMEVFASSPNPSAGSITHYSDITTEPKLDQSSRAFYEAVGVRAILSLPLAFGERMVGTFSIASDQPRTFSDSEQRAFAAIADQITVAVERMTFARQTQKRAVELETVAKVSAEAATNLDMNAVLWSVANLTRDSFDLYHAHIYLLDDTGENLVLAAGAGDIGKQMVAKGHSIPLDRENSLVARAARSRQGVISNDVTQAPDFMPNLLLPETKSEMAVPLVAGENLVGVLDVQSEQVNRFTDEDVRVQTTLAGQVAVAIQNARSYEQTQAVSEQLSDALRTARLGYWEFDFATMSFVLTDELYHILGTSVEAEGGYRIPADAYAQRFVHPDSQHVVAEEIMKAVTSTDPNYAVELTLHSLRADGDEAYDQVRLRLERAADGTPIRAIGATQDITHRVRAEEALRKNREQLSDALRTARLGYWEFDFATGSFTFNDEFYALIGTTAEAEGGYTMPAEVYTARFVHPDEQHVVSDGIETALASDDPGYTVELVARSIRANGDLAYDLVKFRVEKDAEGRPVRIVGANQDITERMRAQEEITRQNAILANSRDFISMTDAQGNLIYVNPGGMQMIGIAPEDVATMKIASVHLPEDAQRVAEEGIPTALQTGHWRGENRLQTRDGHLIPVDQTIFPITDDQGNVMFMATIMTDITQRKQDEAERERLLAEVDRNARFMRRVIDATPDWIFVKDRNFRYTMVNEGYASGIANTPDNMLGRDDLELGFPEELVLGNPEQGIVGFRNDDRRVLAGEDIYNPYDVVTFADGSRHIMATQKVPLRDTNGEVYGILAFARDVTELYTAQKETEALYQVSALINEAHDEQAIIDAVVQHAVGPEISTVTMAVFDTGDRDTASAVILAAEWRRSGEPMRGVSIPIETFANGQQPELDSVTHYNDIANEPLLDESTRQFYLATNTQALLSLPLEIGGRVIGALIIACDQPYTFSDSEQRTFTTIADQMTVAIERMTFARQMQKRAIQLETVAKVSAAATTVLAVQELLDAVTELTKTSFGLYHAHVYLLDEESSKLALAAGAGDAGRIMRAQSHHIPMSRENSLVARAARTRQSVIVNDVTQEMGFLPNPLLPDTRSEMAIPMIVGGSLIGVLDVQSEEVNHFTDEDARVQATLASQVAVAIRNAMAFERERGIADRLREIDRLKSEFIANMSHELRTPLNSIIGYSEVLLDGVDGDLSDDALEDIRAIHGSGQHLLTIINDILDLAKIEAGQMRIDPQPVDLGAFVKDIVHAGQILVKNKPVELRLEAQEDLPQVHADPVRLRQIVWNIISNAVKFTEQGSVTIQLDRSSENSDQAVIRITDTGIGIKKELLPVVFERFRQVDGSSTRRAGGTGLGLAITRHLVQLHGGDIHVDSEEGQGSTFWLTLPLHVQEAVEG